MVKPASWLSNQCAYSWRVFALVGYSDFCNLLCYNSSILKINLHRWRKVMHVRFFLPSSSQAWNVEFCFVSGFKFSQLEMSLCEICINSIQHWSFYVLFRGHIGAFIRETGIFSLRQEYCLADDPDRNAKSWHGEYNSYPPDGTQPRGLVWLFNSLGTTRYIYYYLPACQDP